MRIATATERIENTSVWLDCQHRTHYNNSNIEKEKFSKIFSTEFNNKLTEDQRQIFDYIINYNKENMFYIDGPGSSSKMFLYKALIYNFISLGKKLLSLAWTGIASIL